jgi:thymidylate kinase
MAQPTLIVIGGFAGAGKTTVTNRLSASYNYPVFSSDDINDALRVALQKTFKEISSVAYRVMWHLIKKQLSNDIVVVADVHMAADHIWKSLDQLSAEMPNVRVLPIILKASLDTHRSRIEERGRTNKEHLNLGGDKLEDILFKYEYIETLDRPNIIMIDANGSAEEVYASVEQCIKDALSSQL